MAKKKSKKKAKCSYKPDKEYISKTLCIKNVNKGKFNKIKEYIELHGGTTSESVRKKTDVVLVGENPGSKGDKALELNIPIWNQDKLFEIMTTTGNK